MVFRKGVVLMAKTEEFFFFSFSFYLNKILLQLDVN